MPLRIPRLRPTLPPKPSQLFWGAAIFAASACLLTPHTAPPVDDYLHSFTLLLSELSTRVHHGLGWQLPAHPALPVVRAAGAGCWAKEEVGHALDFVPYPAARFGTPSYVLLS